MYQFFEDAISPSECDIAQKSILPYQSTFKKRMYEGWDMSGRKRAIKKVKKGGGKLVITHTDADGLVSGALFVDSFDDVEVVTADYGHIEEVLEMVDSIGGVKELYIADLNLDDVPSVIESIAEQVDSFVWLDHHEWEEKRDIVSNMGVDLRVNHDRCGAGMVYDYLVAEYEYEPTETADEIVEITEDYDLWIHETEEIQVGDHTMRICEALSQLAFWSDDETFMNDILDAGREFMDLEEHFLRDKYFEGFIAHRESEGNQKIEYILENETTIKDIHGYVVAFAHGNASPGKLLNKLVDVDDIDILIHTKPSYPVKVSIRSTEQFNYCHHVAEKLGGGGHANAAGCNPDFAQDPMEFFEYVIQHGEPLKNKIESVLDDYLDSDFDSLATSTDDKIIA